MTLTELLTESNWSEYTSGIERMLKDIAKQYRIELSSEQALESHTKIVDNLKQYIAHGEVDEANAPQEYYDLAKQFFSN